MDIHQWINSLVPEIQKTIIFGSVTFSIALAFYLRRRYIDKRWLREHGLVLFVYFRNVEWRCQRLQSMANSIALTRIRLELTKLQSDIDALDRLLAMWNRRMKFIHLSFGYVKHFDDVHDAFTELQICLLRHALPLMELLSVRSSATSNVDVKLDQELQQYMAYFNGGADRIWSSGLEGQGNDASSEEQSALAEMRRTGLQDRIELLHKTLGVLFDKIGGINTKKLKIWKTSEVDGVWFRAQSINSPQESTGV